MAHDPATFNEVNALIRVGNGEQYVRFSHRRDITNRFLDWHYAQGAVERDRMIDAMEAEWMKVAVEGTLDSPRGHCARLVDAWLTAQKEQTHV